MTSSERLTLEEEYDMQREWITDENSEERHVLPCRLIFTRTTHKWQTLLFHHHPPAQRLLLLCLTERTTMRRLLGTPRACVTAAIRYLIEETLRSGW